MALALALAIYGVNAIEFTGDLRTSEVLYLEGV
jgi:hypothetical protein